MSVKTKKYHKLILLDSTERESIFILDALVLENSVTWVFVNSRGTEVIPLSSVLMAFGGE